MNSLYDRNISIINEHLKPLYRALFEKKPSYEIALEYLEQDFNFQVRTKDTSCFIHSIYNVNDEMEDMFKHVPQDAETIVIFGLGCGYAIEYIIENYNMLRHLIIIEPTSQIFNEVLNKIDLSKYIKAVNKITFSVNVVSKEVISVINNSLLENINIHFVAHISYITLFNNYYKEIMEAVTEKIRYNRGTISTAVNSNLFWLNNSILNLQYYKNGIEDISKIFKNQTIVIVSAGPSLNKNMHLLSKMKEKAIILAVGSAIRILDKNGIIPDFRVASDGLPREKIFLEGIDTEKAPLIYSNKLYHEILPEYKSDTFCFVGNSDFIIKYFYKKMNREFLDVKVGPSIANAVLNLICTIGCKKVIFVGQDLSYVGDKIRANGGNVIEGELDKESNNVREMLDIYGNKVLTKDMYLMMKYSLENTIKNHNEIEFENATEGGLPIKGTINKTLQQVIDDEECNNKGSHSIKEIDELDRFKFEQSLKLKIIEEIKREVQNIIDINEERIVFLKKIDKNFKKNINIKRVKRDLDYVSKFQRDIERNSFYKEVIQETLKTHVLSLNLKYQYNGEDEIKKVESTLKLYLNISTIVSITSHHILSVFEQVLINMHKYGFIVE
jgi:hypothetical protein